jgi:hypothetical protein
VEGKLKEGFFFEIGNRQPYHGYLPKGKIVTIVESEDHFLWGKRYRIAGYKEWFEANCFEYVEED